jgi:hypothetical protein
VRLDRVDETERTFFGHRRSYEVNGLYGAASVVDRWGKPSARKLSSTLVPLRIWGAEKAAACRLQPFEAALDAAAVEPSRSVRKQRLHGFEEDPVPHRYAPF